jgi:hypothetical protein
MIKSKMQKSCLRGLMSALIVGGAIASSGGYAVAEIQFKPLCIPSPTNPCVNPGVVIRPDEPHPEAVIIDQIRKIFKSKQAIKILEISDPYTVDKLIQGDVSTLRKLERLSPSTKLQVQLYLQQLNQPVIDRYRR